MSRLIDRDRHVRTRPMQVLCLGLPRTATTALFVGLGQLGYKPYHMYEALQNPTRDLEYGLEAWKAKYLNQGKPYGREEFDKWIGDFDATADVPMALLAEELIAAYPDAKIILNSRPVDRWVNSIDSSVGAVLAWWSWPVLSCLDPIIHSWFRFGVFFMRIPGLDQKRFFLGHYETVRQLLKERGEEHRMIEWTATDGWEPICKLLEKDIPDTPFPKINEASNFVKFHQDLRNAAWGRVAWKAFVRAVPVAAAGVGLWAYYGGWGQTLAKRF